jgi:hypothetical protein
MDFNFGHWDEDDYFGNDPKESVSFGCPCKWCGKSITMTPTESGWKPMSKGKIHICEARIKVQQKAMVAQMPDLTLPECQFCGTHMAYQKVEPDPDEGWFHSYRLQCSGCGSHGPLIEQGSEKWNEIYTSGKPDVSETRKGARVYGFHRRTPERKYSPPMRDNNPMPSDAGEDVCDDRGSVIGRRGYTKFNSDEWVAQTIYSDGSSVTHCGGPCGDLYADEFGNT